VIAENLARREFPEARNEFLRCQVGVVIMETRRVLRDGFRNEFVTIPVELFRLLGYGDTWDQALAMASAHPLVTTRNGDVMEVFAAHCQNKLT
jgi:hypothetical protein